MINGELTWKSILELVFDRVSGKNKEVLSETDYDKVNQASAELVDKVGLDEVLPCTKKFLNLNVLDKNVNFKELERFPIVWQKVYGTAIDVVAVEARQLALAK